MRDDTGRNLRPITRIAAYSALNVVDKYIRLLQESDLYFMAVALCPWHKLHWFTKNGFTFGQADNVRSMLYNQYNKLYAPYIRAPAPAQAMAPHVSHPIGPSKPKNRWMELPLDSDVASAATSTPATAMGAIDAYLASPLVAKDNKVKDGGLLAYWTREQSQGSPIAEMALDILTAPASSVDAERAFSSGRMAVNYRQHRMNLSTFRAKMALGSWYGTPLLPNIQEVVDVLNDGSEHTTELPNL
ncbi:hypothetical protein FS749_010569 [Ceratobasidium sp. UAMH 11750]|nr:hypothetical protein FS749_010569 [Ceratobasidium sp. UAMH 11750]